MCQAAQSLKGFSTQACVLRRSNNHGICQIEVRRWSNEEYLPLSNPAAGADMLLLGADGMLVLRRMDGTRQLRNKPEDQIVDEIYVFNRVVEPTSAQLNAVRRRAIGMLYPLGYENWLSLTAKQRRILVSFAGRWENAALALEQCQGRDRVEALQLFLGPHAAKSLRNEVITAGAQGRLRPGADVLAWLLAQSDWNLNPGLVNMAQSAVEDEPEKAWALTTHPNPQIRLRLADIYTASGDLLGWLMQEQDLAVRGRVLLAIERRLLPRHLVAQIKKEKDHSRREALGWALVHWSTGISQLQDWQAMNRALFEPIGSKNKAELKDKLNQHGQLSWKARLLA